MNAAQRNLVAQTHYAYPQFSNEELATQFDVSVAQIEWALRTSTRMQYIRAAIAQCDRMKEDFERRRGNYTGIQGQALLDLCTKLLLDVAAAVMDLDGRVASLEMARKRPSPRHKDDGEDE